MDGQSDGSGDLDDPPSREDVPVAPADPADPPVRDGPLNSA